MDLLRQLEEGIVFATQPLGILSSIFLIWILYNDRNHNIFNICIYAMSRSFLVYNLCYIITNSMHSESEEHYYIYGFFVILRETCFLTAHFASSILSYSIYYLIQYKKPLMAEQIKYYSIAFLAVMLALYISFGISQYVGYGTDVDTSFIVSLVFSFICALYNLCMFIVIHYLFRTRYLQPEMIENMDMDKDKVVRPLSTPQESFNDANNNVTVGHEFEVPRLERSLTVGNLAANLPPAAKEKKIRSLSRQTQAIHDFLVKIRLYPLVQWICLFPIFLLALSCSSYRSDSPGDCKPDRIFTTFWGIFFIIYCLNSFFMSIIYYFNTPDIAVRIQGRLGRDMVSDNASEKNLQNKASITSNQMSDFSDYKRDSDSGSERESAEAEETDEQSPRQVNQDRTKSSVVGIELKETTENPMNASDNDSV